MSARNYTLTFAAGQVQRLPAGKYFFVRTATSALDIEARAQGNQNLFLQIGAGSKFGPLEENWRYLDVTSAAAQTVEIIISDDGNFEVANTVNVAGTVPTVDSPSATIATPAAVTFATAAASSIAANLARRRITISSLDTNAGNLFVQTVGAGAGRGYMLQPGMSAEFRTTAALDVRNDTGANATYSTFEES